MGGTERWASTKLEEGTPKGEHAQGGNVRRGASTTEEVRDDACTEGRRDSDCMHVRGLVFVVLPGGGITLGLGLAFLCGPHSCGQGAQVMRRREGPSVQHEGWILRAQRMLRGVRAGRKLEFLLASRALHDHLPLPCWPAWPGRLWPRA